MTEMLDARETRQQMLKGIISDLHAGTDLGEIKQRFRHLVQNVSPSEIAEMEENLIAEGMPPEELRCLCDVHVALFKEMLGEQPSPDLVPGHPVHTFRLENQAIQQVVTSLKELLAQLYVNGKTNLPDFQQAIASQLEMLREIDKHYLRKEHQLFPALEQRGVTGPPKVMWQTHDEIRKLLKDLKSALQHGDTRSVMNLGEQVVEAVSEMVYKEENILFPMALEKLSDEDWVQVRRGEEELGYTLVTPVDQWSRPQNQAAQSWPEQKADGGMRLDTGQLTLEQINLMLTHLPVDVTFVDASDRVRYYSQGQHRVFPRSPGIIGRLVHNCHPASSVHVVKEILDGFRTGTKNQAEFWLEMESRLIHIRYFAVHNQAGEYVGTMEVTQDVTDIRVLEGQKRLLDW